MVEAKLSLPNRLSFTKNKMIFSSCIDEGLINSLLLVTSRCCLRGSNNFWREWDQRRPLYYKTPFCYTIMNISNCEKISDDGRLEIGRHKRSHYQNPILLQTVLDDDYARIGELVLSV